MKQFHDYLLVLMQEVPEKNLHIQSICQIIWNVYNYYSQYTKGLQDFIDSQKKPILKDLSDYVKIASWKDINVYALKESAKRSHYHLHKFLKKYREILSIPVKDKINLLRQEVKSISKQKRLSFGEKVIALIDSLRVSFLKELSFKFCTDFVSSSRRYNSLPQLLGRSHQISQSIINGM